jgi:hypothetical protein
MGGGPDTPTKQMSSKKELVLCTLPFPEEGAKKGIEGLKEEFKDVEVKYYYTSHDKPTEVPEGMSWSSR